MILTLVSMSYADEEQEFKVGDSSCEDTLTSIPPFYVSDTYKQGDKIYDNLRDENNFAQSYIPKGAIIQTSPELFEVEASDDFRVPIKVLSLPDEKIEETLAKSDHWDFRHQIQGTKKEQTKKTNKLDRAKLSEEGFLHRNSLKKINDYVFMVKQTAPVYETPKGTPLNDKKIRIKTNNKGEFVTKTCCTHLTEVPDELLCSTFYLYEIILGIDENGDEIIENQLTYNMGCGFISDLMPIPEKDYEEVSGIVKLLGEYADTDTDLEYFNQSVEILPQTTVEGKKAAISLVKIPVDKNDNGPYNSYHYKPDDDVSSDAFLTPVSNCTFLQVLKEFDKKCTTPGCKVLFGDMYHKQSWKAHLSHGGGECIDIRFFRKNSDNPSDGVMNFPYTKEVIEDGVKTDVKVGSSNLESYDRDKMEMFIDVLLKAGADNIFVNDSKLRALYTSSKLKEVYSDVQPSPPSNFEKPGYASGHHDHMHFCFPKASPQVQNTCKEGFKQK